MGGCYSASNSLLKSNENVEIFNLIWLKNPSDKSKEFDDLERDFRKIINYLKIFTDEYDCHEYLQNISSNDHCILIVHDQISEHFLSKIHSCAQLFSIYAYSNQIEFHPAWFDQLTKIKSISHNSSELLKHIQADENHFEYLRNPFLFDLFDSNESEEVNRPFFYSQICIHVLLNMDALATDRNDLITLCRNQYKGNKIQLKTLRNFRKNYSSVNALFWLRNSKYFWEIFFKAWQNRNLNTLFLYRFFLQDIEEELHANQCPTSICTYRSQILSIDDWSLLKSSVGKLISISRFLLANLSRESIDSDLKEENSNYQTILFEITAKIDLEKQYQFGRTSHENEVLFMFASIFSIDSIHQQTENHLWTIQMTLTDRTNPSFARFSSEYPINLLSFGVILEKMHLFTQTEFYYQRLFNELSDDDEQIPYCSFHLSNLALKKSDYQTSLEWLLKSLDFSLRLFDSNDPFLALIYKHLSHIYYQENESKLAIDYLEKAIRIWQRSIDENSQNLAECLNNMGIIYKHTRNYDIALEYFQKTLLILEKFRSKDDLDFTKVYSNLASTYRQIGEYELALEYSQFTLKILEKYYPLDHANLAKAFGNLGIVYALKGDKDQALFYYNKAADIYRTSLPLTHINNIKLEQLIRNVSVPNRSVSFGAIEYKR